MKILLTGSNGQLGNDFQKLFDGQNIKYIATDYQELDITSVLHIMMWIKQKLMTKFFY